MSFKKGITKKVSKGLLGVLFGLSLINGGYAYSQSDCLGDADCIKNKDKLAKMPDNFSNPDGFIDSKYGYTYFAFISSKNSPTHTQIIEKCLSELKKGNKTQQIYSNLIFAYNFTKQGDKANKVALDFVKDFPNSAEAYHLLAFNYKGKKAIELLEKAVNLNPKNPSYRMDLAATYAFNGQNDKALKEYQKIKNEYPDTFSDIDERIMETQSSEDKIRSVKANMHTFQTMIETHGVDFEGLYPSNFLDLQKEAQLKTYWKNIFSPFSLRKENSSVIDYSTYLELKNDKEFLKGKVVYLPIDCKDNKDTGKVFCKNYKIYGLDEKGEMIKDKNELFYLTNF